MTGGRPLRFWPPRLREDSSSAVVLSSEGEEAKTSALRRGEASSPSRLHGAKEFEMREPEMELGELVRKCHICNQSFALQEDLSKHLKDAHGVGEPASGSGS